MISSWNMRKSYISFHLFIPQKCISTIFKNDMIRTIDEFFFYATVGSNDLPATPWAPVFRITNNCPPFPSESRTDITYRSFRLCPPKVHDVILVAISWKVILDKISSPTGSILNFFEKKP
jgi:hypothetical protein